MLRRHSTRTTSNVQKQSYTTDSLRLSSRPMRRRTRKTSPDVMFKAIVVIELLFLLCMWTLYADRIRSSRLWRRDKLPIPRTDHRATNHDNNIYKQDKHLPAWERRLKDESRERHDREQRARRALAAHGTIKEIPDNRKGPTLVIGGSDGSGTRAFAHIMIQLGVPMRIQDKESFDIHGAEMFQGQGWPPLAQMILNATHSANYELSDLPNATQTTVKKEMQILKDAFDVWQLKLEQRYYTKEKMDMKVERASKASIGFKAPVTMLLLPLVKEIFGSIKYLHIVRDGRDISLSTNKSPVQKFYQSMYPDADERMNKYANGSYPVLAMNLWSDWNTQAWEWEQAHASDPDFDCLVVRSEDLVDPSSKFETLARLAAFVGSPKTLKELCCMSREEDVDMGKSLVSSDVAAGDYHTSRQGFFKRNFGSNMASSWLRGGTTTTSGGGKVEAPKEHLMSLFGNVLFPGGLLHDAYDDDSESSGDDDHRRLSLWEPAFSKISNHQYAKSHPDMRKRRDLLMAMDKRLLPAHEGEPASKVHSRYGKWRETLKDEPELSAKLHEEGAKGLAAFGYEPEGPFMDARDSPVKDFQCDETVICDESTTRSRTEEYRSFNWKH